MLYRALWFLELMYLHRFGDDFASPIESSAAVAKRGTQ